MMLQRVQTKVQPFGCGHKMHSEAFPAHINLFQSRSITFSLELHWENNGGGKLSLGMFDSFFGRQIGVNYSDGGLVEEMDNSMYWGWSVDIVTS